MNPFILSETEDTPSIILDPENNKFSFSNVSLPEDAVEFYMPVFHWLKEYSKSPKPESVFIFKIEYLNTASSKQIFELILFIEKIKDARIKWYYEAIDEDMESLGQRFKNLVSIDLELIPYDV